MDWAWGKRAAEELYDLRNDPDQLTNLANTSQFASQRVALSEQLMGILKETGDPRMVGEGDAFDRSPYLEAKVRNRKGKR